MIDPAVFGKYGGLIGLVLFVVLIIILALIWMFLRMVNPLLQENKRIAAQNDSLMNNVYEMKSKVDEINSRLIDLKQLFFTHLYFNNRRQSPRK